NDASSPREVPENAVGVVGVARDRNCKWVCGQAHRLAQYVPGSIDDEQHTRSVPRDDNKLSVRSRGDLVPRTCEACGASVSAGDAGRRKAGEIDHGNAKLCSAEVIERID